VINQYLRSRCRHDSLDCVSLTDDLDLLRATRKSLQTAMNRGSWFLVHYAPSRAAGAMLADVFTQMTTASVNNAFRLVIIASALDFIAPSMIARSKKISVESFPGIRNAMLQAHVHAHHGSSGGAALRKLSYASALAFAVIAYRNFIEPVGFAADFALADVQTLLPRIAGAGAAPECAQSRSRTRFVLYRNWSTQSSGLKT
jgi:hypothetical protein